jgi:hypothetical protein
MGFHNLVPGIDCDFIGSLVCVDEAAERPGIAFEGLPVGLGRGRMTPMATAMPAIEVDALLTLPGIALAALIVLLIEVVVRLWESHRSKDRPAEKAHAAASSGNAPAERRDGAKRSDVVRCDHIGGLPDINTPRTEVDPLQPPRNGYR